MPGTYLDVLRNVTRDWGVKSGEDGGKREACEAVDVPLRERSNVSKRLTAKAALSFFFFSCSVSKKLTCLSYIYEFSSLFTHTNMFVFVSVFIFDNKLIQDTIFSLHSVGMLDDSILSQAV